MLTVGSLFSGIGGIDLGLERAGMKVLWQVEIDEWCRAVLAKHWPNVERFADVRDVGAHNLAAVDVIAGGFPCQDISIAGRAAGIRGARSGLWTEFGRIIRDLRPRYVLVENVTALLHRGVDVVLGDLATCGYDAEWDCIPAAAVGAPHLRDRIWIVAYRQGDAPRPHANGERSHRAAQHERPSEFRDEQGCVARSLGGAQSGRTELSRTLADTNDGRPLDAFQAGRYAAGDGGTDVEDANGGTVESRRGRRRTSEASELAESASGRRRAVRSGGSAGVGEGLSEQALPDADGAGRGEQRGAVAALAEYAAAQRGGWWLTEPAVGRVAHGVPRRVDRLRGLGNAVVPQIPELIGHAIVADTEVTA